MTLVAREATTLELRDWELCEIEPGAASTPETIDDAGSGADWMAAVVPGTVALALSAAQRWSLSAPRDLDAREWWYRARFHATEGATATLRLDGLASIAEVFVNGERVLSSLTMHRAHELSVGPLAAENTLHLRFSSLTQALRARRPRPRWKTRLVANQQLRWFRTTLLGRIAGWTPPVTPIGPTREVSLRSSRWRVLEHALRSELQGTTGVVFLRARVTGSTPTSATLRVGDVETPATVTAEGDAFVLQAEARLADVSLWWPHTHGAQPLHDVSLQLHDGTHTSVLDAGRTGFRRVEALTDDDGFALRVNGVPVFARGACWMPTDPIGLQGEAVRRTLEQLRDAGMNIVRCTGTMPYEPGAFFDACDELGILIMQDFAFANLDYPATDEAFVAEIEREARALVERTALSPAMTVFAGGSEVEQQAAMVGMPADAWSNALFDRVLPDAVAAGRPDGIYVRNSPTGGALPFSVDQGISHYYGVGAYLRPLTDARHAGVRFTTECLGFSNVPAPRTCELVLGDGQTAPQSPAWKARVPRDGGVGWDFEDVRDHYLATLYGVDPARLRYADPERYLALSRELSGDVMARTMREWRRGASSCRGAIVWFLRDLWPGAGWGVIDATGAPKAAYFHLRRALAPVALALIDEGLNGLRAHVWNDGPEALPARLRLQAYKDGEIETAARDVNLLVPAHGETVTSVDAALGTFVDTTYAYRFGPPAHDLIVASLHRDDGAGGERRLGDASFLPQGPPLERARDLGLTATAVHDGERWFLDVSTRRLAWGVTIDLDGFTADDDSFTLPPGLTRRLSLQGTGTTVRGAVSALNAATPARVVVSS